MTEFSEGDKIDIQKIINRDWSRMAWYDMIPRYEEREEKEWWEYSKRGGFQNRNRTGQKNKSGLKRGPNITNQSSISINLVMMI